MDIKIVYDKNTGRVYKEDEVLSDDFDPSYITHIEDTEEKLTIVVSVTKNID
jgi:hypothetical protein